MKPKLGKWMRRRGRPNGSPAGGVARGMAVSACALIAAAAGQAPAATKTYVGGGGSGNWDADANWSSPGPPASGDDVVVAAAAASTRLYLSLAASADLGPFASLTLNAPHGVEIYSNSTDVLSVGRLSLGGTYGDAVMQNFSLTVGAGGFYLGEAANSNATLYMTPPGTLAVNGDAYVGYGGAGLLVLSDKPATVTGTLTVAGGANGTGRVTIGAGSLAADVVRLIAGGVIEASGTGVVSFRTFVQSGGSNSAAGFFRVDRADGAAAEYRLSGGKLKVGKTLTVADRSASTFVHTGGTAAVSVLQIGSPSVAGRPDGSYALSADGYLNAQNIRLSHGTFAQAGGLVEAGALNVGYGAAGAEPFAADRTPTYTLSAGTLATDNTYVGNQGGTRFGGVSNATFVQTGGLHYVDVRLEVDGDAGRTGTYSLRGGTLDTGSIEVGFGAGAGVARFDQTGGTNSCFGYVGVAGRGEYNFTGGVLDAHGIYVAGTGAFRQPVSGVTVYGTGIGVSGDGVYTLGGGAANPKLVTRSLSVGDTGVFELKSGSLVVGEEQAPGTGLINVGQIENDVGTLNVRAGSVAAGTILAGGDGAGIVNQSGGTVTLSSDLTLAWDGPAAGTSGTYNLSGGALVTPKVRINPKGTLVASGGTITAGVIECDGLIRIEGPTRFDADLLYTTGHAASQLGPGITVNGPLTISGHVTATTCEFRGGAGGALIFTPGSSIRMAGVIDLPVVSNAGAFSTNFVTPISAAFTNAPTGSLTAVGTYAKVTLAKTLANDGALFAQAGGAFVLDAGVGGAGTIAIDPGCSIRATFIRQGSLTLSSDATGAATASVAPRAAGGQTSRLGALRFASAGGAAPARFDLADTALIVGADPAAPGATLAGVRAAVAAAYAGGTWAGPGLGSAVAAASGGAGALGYATGSQALGLAGAATADWLGQPAGAKDVLVRYTLAGDATLDGAVDFEDLVRLAQNYNTAVSARTDSWWFDGDFTYDGVTDFNDLVKLAQNYNTALPSRPVPGAPANFDADLAAAFATVPEPSALPLALVAAYNVARRRRRRRPLSARAAA